MGFRNTGIGDFAVIDINAFCQSFIIKHCLFPAFFGNLQKIRQGCIGECQGRSPGNRPGNIGDGIMNDIILDKYGLARVVGF